METESQTDNQAAAELLAKTLDDDTDSVVELNRDDCSIRVTGAVDPALQCAFSTVANVTAIATETTVGQVKLRFDVETGSEVVRFRNIRYETENR